jgi:hypothetical protein
MREREGGMACSMHARKLTDEDLGDLGDFTALPLAECGISPY